MNLSNKELILIIQTLQEEYSRIEDKQLAAGIIFKLQHLLKEQSDR